MADYTRARGLLAMHGPNGMRPDPERFEAARQDFTAAKAVRQVRKTLDDGPPLTDEQRSRLIDDLAAAVRG